MSGTPIWELCANVGSACAGLLAAHAQPYTAPRLHEVNNVTIWHLFSGPPHIVEAEEVLGSANANLRTAKEKLRALKWEREAPAREAHARKVAALDAAREAAIRCHACRDTDCICVACDGVPADQCGYAVGHMEDLEACPECQGDRS